MRSAQRLRARSDATTQRTHQGHATEQKRPFGPVTVAKAYRLLHSIMNTAVEDGKIRRNPCRIKGAGQEYSPERPVVPVGTLIPELRDLPMAKSICPGHSAVDRRTFWLQA